MFLDYQDGKTPKTGRASVKNSDSIVDDIKKVLNISSVKKSTSSFRKEERNLGERKCKVKNSENSCKFDTFKKVSLIIQIDFAEKQFKTLALSLVLLQDETKNKIMDVCLPESLKKWKEAKNYKDAPGTKYASKGQSCQISLKDLDGKTKSGKKKSMKERVGNWDALDKQLKNDEILKKYSKVCLR